jgi:transposase
MPKTRELSKEQRAQIKILINQQMSTRKIANIMNVSQSTVVYTMQRYKEKQSSTPRKRSGRPRITSAGSDRKIHRAAIKNPTLSSFVISAEIGCRASARTVRRRLLDDFNLPSRRPAKKARLSAKNIRDRIAFCKKYKDWTEDQWLGVTFSDESTFSQFSSYVRSVRRPPRQRYNMRYVVPSVKQAPTTMVWSCFSGRGRGALWFMPKNTTINGAVYLGILQEKLLIHMGLLNSTVFQQDGAPCHRTAAVSRWLADNNIEVLGPWPGSSPDLNPIENMWVMMKRKVSKLNPTSEAALTAAIKDVWVKDITPAYCERLARSMPSRIRLVLAAKGQHSKY